MSYFMVQGCSTLFNSLEEANKKALEIANEKLSKSLFDYVDKEESYEDYDYTTGERLILTRTIKVLVPKFINSKEELIDLATEFDYILSTYVTELFEKEELIQS